MTHCYIFDYANCKIYHTIVPEGEDIDIYCLEKLGTKGDNIHILCSDEELEIEEL